MTVPQSAAARHHSIAKEAQNLGLLSSSGCPVCPTCGEEVHLTEGYDGTEHWECLTHTCQHHSGGVVRYTELANAAEVGDSVAEPPDLDLESEVAADIEPEDVPSEELAKHTDVHLSELLVDDHKDGLFCAGRGRWYGWDGLRFEYNAGAAVSAATVTTKRAFALALDHLWAARDNLREAQKTEAVYEEEEKEEEGEVGNGAES